VEQGAISERYARALERCIRDDPPGWLLVAPALEAATAVGMRV
jgi:hypothetical protein